MTKDEFRNNLIQDISKKFKYSSSTKNHLRELIIEQYSFLGIKLLKTVDNMDVWQFNIPNNELQINISYDKSIYQNSGKDYRNESEIVLSENVLYKIIDIV